MNFRRVGERVSGLPSSFLSTRLNAWILWAGSLKTRKETAREFATTSECQSFGSSSRLTGGLIRFAESFQAI